jgi:hypothetical protein
MSATIAALIGAILSFAGAMLGIWFKSTGLKQELQQARGGLELQLHQARSGLELQLEQAHNDLKLQLRDGSINLEQSIDAQASDLKQQLTFEGKRDKRPIYAAALAALKKFEIADTDDNDTAARVAVGEVALVAPRHIWDAAEATLDPLCRMPATSADRASRFKDSWNQMVQAMRIDLGVSDPWQPAAANPPTLGG